jgi:hypothetical protein
MPPTPVATATPATKAHATQGKAAPPPPVPFTRASEEHWETCALDESFTLDGSSHGPIALEVPAAGYLRAVLLRVRATGGVAGGTPAVAKADAPWSVVQSNDLADVSGSPLIDTLTGYEQYQVNKLGGYAWSPDPATLDSFSPMDADGNFEWIYRLPVEISAREGLGALPNMNAKQIFRSKIRQAPSEQVYATEPGTLPTVRYTATMEGWTAPQTGEAPPSLGTVQQWSSQTYNVKAGSQRIPLERVGNAIRNLILIARDDNGDRADSMFPDDLTVKLDQRMENIQPRAVRRHLLSERYGFAMDAGVDVLDFTHDFDGHPGGEMRDLWVITTTASRYELIGTWAGAGTLTVLTNEVIVPAAGIA